MCLVVSIGFIRVASAAVNTFLGKGVVAFDSIKVGRALMNGTIVNTTTKNGANNPVTIGDNLRIDGNIFRTEIGGTNPLKIADTLRPTTDAVYSLGESTNRFLNLYLSGSLIGTGVVGSDAIVDNAITSAKIADGTIANADFAADAITTAKVADGTIANADLAADAITTVKIVDSAVTMAKIADSAITTAKIADGTIVAGDLGAGSVTGTAIAANTITADKIVDASNASGLRKADIGVLSTIAFVNPPNIPAQSCAGATAVVTGTQPGDIVLASPIDTPLNGLIAVTYDVVLADTIDFWFCNVTAGALNDGPEGWRVLVIR